MWKESLLVFLGAGAGGVLRLWLSRWNQGEFFWGTILANGLASFVVGLFMGLFYEDLALYRQSRLLLLVGFCGGLSTFSTFSYENLELFRNSEWGKLILYVSCSLIGGLLLVGTGFWIGRKTM